MTIAGEAPSASIFIVALLGFAQLGPLLLLSIVGGLLADTVDRRWLLIGCQIEQMVLSFVLSMASHFLVGAARSVFTGRSLFRSGIDMFVVGLGVAIVGYFVGDWIGKLI